jgi:hypothetical protein
LVDKGAMASLRGAKNRARSMNVALTLISGSSHQLTCRMSDQCLFYPSDVSRNVPGPRS